MLLVKFGDQNAQLTLESGKSKWTAIAFVDNGTRIRAKTEDGKVFDWLFYRDVASLEQLARDHLRDVDGSEEQLFDLPSTS